MTLRLYPESMFPDLRQSRQVSYPERRSPDLIPDVCADVPLGLGPGIHPSGAAVRSGSQIRDYSKSGLYRSGIPTSG